MQGLISVITKEAVENLHIEKNQIVTVIFKSSTVVLSDHRAKKSEENRLEGIVEKIDTDVENAKVSVDIGSHDKIVSVISKDILENMGLKVGSPVWVMIKANDIMLGK